MPTTRDKHKRKISEEEMIEDERRQQFLEMGFLPDQAVALSRAKDYTGLLVDRYKIKKALDQGCSPQLAMKIFA